MIEPGETTTVAVARDRVVASVHAARQSAVRLLCDLIVAQREGEDAVQAIVTRRLEAIGAKVDRVVYSPADVPLKGEFAAPRAMATGERASVVGTLPGTGHGRSLILFAHPDSEAVATADTWTRPAFEGTVVAGRLHGWGVADDLAGVAMGVCAMEAVVAAGLSPGGSVSMASTPSKRHARGVAALMHQGLGADAAVYLHPAESGQGLKEIKAFASGQIEFRVTVGGAKPPTTEPGHTAFSHLGVNPVDKAFVLYAALKALDAARGERVQHPWLEAAVGRSTNLHVSNIACGADGRFSRLNPTCTFGGAISFPPTETLDAVRAEVAEAIETAAAADPWLRDNPPVVEWVSGVSAMQLPTDHPLYQLVSATVTAVTGTTPAVNAMHTSSDIRNPINQRNIPTVGIGPLCGDLTQVGSTDEWVDVDDYIAAVAVTAAVIVAWTDAVPTPDPPFKRS